MRGTLSSRKVLIPIALFIFVAVPASAVTVAEYLAKTDGWIAARDNGRFKATVSTFTNVTSGWITLDEVTIYFQDDPVAGWSSRVDVLRDYGFPNTCTMKKFSTPSGVREVFNSEVVYNSESAHLTGVTLWGHSTLPASVFAGTAGQSSLSAYNELASSGSVVVTSLRGTPAWQLNVTFNKTKLNSLMANAPRQFASSDTVTGKYWIDATTGVALEGEVWFYDSVAATNTGYLWRMTSLDTNPTIPVGTFTLPSGTPTRTLDAASAEWMEAQAANM